MIGPGHTGAAVALGRRAARALLRRGKMAVALVPGAVAAKRALAYRHERSRPLALFHDVTIVPNTAFLPNTAAGNGGPIWPGFERLRGPRHLRDGQPIDARPAAPTGPVTRIARDCVWGGMAHAHFGHFITEHASRLPVSLLRRPDDLYLFTTSPGSTMQGLPPYIWAIMEWMGLRRAQTMLVTEPVEAARLRVQPQAEYLRDVTPSRHYLEVLDRVPGRLALTPIPSAILFIPRPDAPQRANGGHAGEAYLAGRLAAAGVEVFDPAPVPLTEQLARYAGAQVLVFAEGSAVHGRQLLGWLDQTIIIIKRRKRGAFAQKMLTPRCRRLSHVQAVGAMLLPVGIAGRVIGERALTLYDLDAVFAAFAAQGIDLSAGWDKNAYRAAVETDISLWLRALQPPLFNRDASLRNVQPTLDAAGFAHLMAPHLTTITRHPS